jgi:O-succinylbenzoate synthase
MKVDLFVVRLPLVAPFRTSFMTEYEREALLVRLRTDDGVEGWGECVAMPDPNFSSEYLGGAVEVLRRYLIPALERGEKAAVKGHLMAKAALETAVLDARLRVSGQSFAEFLGARREAVPAGVSVGIMESIPELVDAVTGYLEAGYQRIKLKIEPGWDEAPVRAVRERFPEVPLQVDANCAYDAGSVEALVRLDDYRLLMIEQPFPQDDLWSHVELGRRLRHRTPICLDESITSPAEAVTAIRVGAAQIINVKPGRVGGYLEAKKIHDRCGELGAGAWVGGMLETGIGRAANVALAGLPHFTLVGDLSGSDRFFTQDVITEPFTMVDGCIKVPTGPGLGVTPDPAFLKSSATRLAP